MAKPSVIALLNASGYSEITSDLLQQARKVLYQDVGAGLDLRDWDTIMASDNPLQSAQTALIEMYQSPDYLRQNMDHLTDLGYSAAQAEWTTRVLYERLGIATYDTSWANNTIWQTVANQNDSQTYSQANSDAIASIPAPSLSIASAATGVQATVSEAGTFSLSVSGNMGVAVSGANIIGEQASLKQGTLTVTSNQTGKTTTSSEYLMLGTAGIDTIEGGNGRVDVIFGGAGNDRIISSSGADILLGGDNEDTIEFDVGGGELISGAAEVNGGAGTDTLRAWSGIPGGNLSVADSEFANVTAMEVLIVSTDNTSTFTLSTNANNAFANGVTVYNPIGALNTTATGYTHNMVVRGNDIVDNGQTGVVDTVAVGTGTNTIHLGAGADQITLNTGIDTVVYSAVTHGGAVGNGGVFAAGDTVNSFTVSGASGSVDLLNFISITNVQNVIGGQASFESVGSAAVTGTNTVSLINNATAASLTDTANVLAAIGDISGNAAGFATGDVHIFAVGNTAGDAFGLYAYTEADGAATVVESDLQLLGVVNTAVTGFDADNIV